MLSVSSTHRFLLLGYKVGYTLTVYIYYIPMLSVSRLQVFAIRCKVVNILTCFSYLQVFSGYISWFIFTYLFYFIFFYQIYYAYICLLCVY